MNRPTAADERIDEQILESRPASVARLFRDRARRSPDDIAYLHFRATELVRVTWSEAETAVTSWAAGLIALGARTGDRVAIASGTCFEWVIADLAIMCAAAATTTVYPNTKGDDVAYLLSDSDCRIVFAEDADQVAKLRAHRAELPGIVKVVCFEDDACDGDWVIGTCDLVRYGEDALAAQPGVVDARVDALRPTDLATIIYTSGTTGRPKGVELTHDAFVSAGASAASIGLMRPDDLQFLWLPLSHVFGKVLLTIPMQVGFPTAIDGRLDKIVENLAIIRPTWMGAAPRIFEKVKGKVVMSLEETRGLKAVLAAWALRTGSAVAAARERGDDVAWPLRAQHAVADRLVLSGIRARFGGRIRFFISGSAPLDPDVARWFASVGLLVCEGYGLTETAAFTCLNRPDPGCYAFGTIGWPAPGTRVRVADDGELLVKGPGVMRGYHGRPDATEEVFTDDGYFTTGDIGRIDERGFVRITDRKKDVFKTSGGKYIAPAHIEAHFKGLCPYVSQFVVVGEGRHYASALVTLDEEAITGWAERNGLGGLPYPRIASSPEARDLVAHYVDELNEHLNRWETIKRFTILERDLSVENGELTPSLKLKRRVVIHAFRPQVDALYDVATTPAGGVGETTSSRVSSRGQMARGS